MWLILLLVIIGIIIWVNIMVDEGKKDRAVIGSEIYKAVMQEIAAITKQPSLIVDYIWVNAEKIRITSYNIHEYKDEPSIVINIQDLGYNPLDEEQRRRMTWVIFEAMKKEGLKQYNVKHNVRWEKLTTSEIRYIGERPTGERTGKNLY